MATARTISEMKTRILARAVEDAELRASLVSDPKSTVSAELDVETPDGFTIVVHEDDSAAAHLSLPVSNQLTPAELAEVAGDVDVNRDSVNIS